MTNNYIFTFNNPSPTGINWLTDNVAIFLCHTNIGIIAFDSKENPSSKDVYLIDSGTDSAMAKKVYTALQAELKNFTLKAIINTHSHADHCGGNAEFVRLTGCKILATFKERGSIENPDLQSTVAYGAFPLPEYQTPYYKSEFSNVDSIIKNNESFNFSDTLKLQCIPLPGHYFDMIGVIVSDNNKKMFFTSDGIFSHTMLSRFWIPFIYDINNFKKSLTVIENTSADFYIPSHGDIYTEVSALYELNMLSILQNEQSILLCLKEKPCTFEDILKYMADSNNISMRLSQFMLIGFTIRSYITDLYVQKKISWTFKDNKMYWRLKAN